MAVPRVAFALSFISNVRASPDTNRAPPKCTPQLTPQRVGRVLRRSPHIVKRHPSVMSIIVCRPKSLTPDQQLVSLRRAIQINPANAHAMKQVMRTPVGRRGGPRRLALLIAHKWPRAGVDLSVQFIDNASKELRKRILLHMNAWAKTANIRFRETAGKGLVRIGRLDSPERLAGYSS